MASTTTKILTQKIHFPTELLEASLNIINIDFPLKGDQFAQSKILGKSSEIHKKIFFCRARIYQSLPDFFTFFFQGFAVVLANSIKYWSINVSSIKKLSVPTFQSFTGFSFPRGPMSSSISWPPSSNWRRLKQKK